MEKQEGRQENAAYRYRFGNVVFDAGRYELQVRDEVLSLENKPLAVLHALLRHAGEVVTKDELLESVWDGRPTVENVLANAVAKLRKALGPVESRALVTVARVGYRLEAVVQRQASEGPSFSSLNLKAGSPVPGRKDAILSELLGRGAGHEVWRAENRAGGAPSVFKFSLGGDALMRLKREATLSRLLATGLRGPESDGVVEALSWNFKQPPFYLECAFGGQDLGSWAESQLGDLDVDARLALFVQIARSVAAAHSLGVLHKDIKPANILVAPAAAGGWRVKLTDFGSSRLLDPSRLEALNITRQGLSDDAFSDESSSGSPLYLAPELVGGASASVQSDIYALGILLYQLLAGDLKQPMASGWQAMIGDTLLEQDIAAATAGDPAARLQAASDLIERIEQLEPRRRRRREEEAARQRHTQAQIDLTRIRARRPWMFGAAAALLIGLVGMSLLFLRSEAALSRAERINAFWNEELVRASNPHASGQLSLVDVLDRAAARLPQRFPDDPGIRAAIHDNLGQAYLGLTRQEQGIAEFRRALAAYEEAGGGNAEPALLARFQLARALWIGSKFEAGARVLDEALARAAPLSRQSDAVAYAAARTRAVAAVRREQWEDAVVHLRKALAWQRRLVTVSPEEWFKIRIELVDGLRHISDPEAALAVLDEMLAEAVDPAAVGLGRYATARLQSGQILLDLGRLAEAEAAIRRALTEIAEAYGPDAYNLHVAEYDYAVVNFKLRHFGPAVEYAQRAWQGMRKVLGPEHIVSFKVQTMVGIAQLYAGQLGAALATLDQALTGTRRAAGADSVSTQGPAFYLALGLARAGRHSEALPLVRALDPDGLRANFPAEDWDQMLPALRGLILWGAGEQALAQADLQRGRQTVFTDAERYPLIAEMGSALRRP